MAFRGGVVAVANPYGAEAGAEILEQGGNAIDAAVAITYALNVVEPQSAGVGGGGFMMIYLAGTHETFFIDTREKAPAGATPDMFVGVPNPTLQGVAVGVPGMVRGTALALERYGNLKLADVIQPAIKLADEGFAATPRYTAVSCNNGGRSTNSPEAAAYFCPNGQPAPVGSLVQNKPLAQTFRLIAANGPDCFYKLIPGEGVRHRQGHRRRSEIQPSAGPERQGRHHDLRRPGKLSGHRPRAGRRDLPRLSDQVGRTTHIRRSDDPSDAEDARALPARRCVAGLRLRLAQDRKCHGRCDARCLRRSFDLDG